MAVGKSIREKGKIKFSEYFKKIEEGSRVAVVLDKGISNNIPKRISGKSGKVVGSRGKFKIVELKDGAKMKSFIIHPVHLKRL